MRLKLDLLPEEALELRVFLRSRPERDGAGHLARALQHTTHVLSHELVRHGHSIPDYQRRDP